MIKAEVEGIDMSLEIFSVSFEISESGDSNKNGEESDFFESTGGYILYAIIGILFIAFIVATVLSYRKRLHHEASKTLHTTTVQMTNHIQPVNSTSQE